MSLQCTVFVAYKECNFPAGMWENWKGRKERHRVTFNDCCRTVLWL